MKSVYVNDALHQKLKKLAVEQQQTLMALLNRLVQEGIDRLEKARHRPQAAARDPMGMFGTKSQKKVEVEKAYDDSRYQDVGEVAFAAAKLHQSCAAYYYRLKEAEVPVILSNPALDETWRLLLKLETEQLHRPQSFWEIYQEEAERLRPIFHKLREFTMRLTQLPHVTMVGAKATTYETALEVMEQSLLQMSISFAFPRLRFIPVMNKC